MLKNFVDVVVLQLSLFSLQRRCVCNICVCGLFAGDDDDCGGAAVIIYVGFCHIIRDRLHPSAHYIVNAGRLFPVIVHVKESSSHLNLGPFPMRQQFEKSFFFFPPSSGGWRRR